MTSLSPQDYGSSLWKSYTKCIESFGRFILALGKENCRVICLEQVHLSQILEEYGRTKIWGDQTKAYLPPRARGSLDDTLRHEDELKGLVQGILFRLRALLGQATYIAEKKHDPVAGSDQDSIGSVSADSNSDSSDDGEHQDNRMPKIRLLVQQVLAQIRSLYDLSALLRRPKVAGKYIRSVHSITKKATLENQDTMPLSAGFSGADESHIVEKVLQWRGLTKSQQCIEFEDEDVAPMGQESTNSCFEDILWFCQRLAAANTRRREQLQYWTDHPYDDPKEDWTSVARLSTPNMTLDHAEQAKESQESRSQADTSKPSNPNVSREGSKSAVSKQSFSTAAVSDIHDPKTNVRPRTLYAPTAIGQGRYNSVPDPPKTQKGQTTFPCPYCGMTLESSEMQNRQLWKRHVFRDLRPYVCTFEDCPNAGKLYVSRNDWMYHEFQIHRREYVCKECHEKCPSKKEMSTHLREHYGESISPAHLSVILDLCDHQVDVSDHKKDACLVCGEELSLLELQKHLAAHMEDIALFVLSSTNEDEETGDSGASVRVAKLKSKGTDSDSESEVSSLGFSVAGGYEQTPDDFSKLLTSEEAEYTSKFLSWRTTNEDQELASIKAAVARLKDPDEDVRRAAVQALSDQSALPEEIFEIRLEYLNGLIELLGEKKDYKSLVWLLDGLWKRRNQMVNWSHVVTLQLAHRYILVRFLVGDALNAIRLAEDIVYNCRRVNGAGDPGTLEMSILLSQLYIGIAQHCLAENGNQLLANKYYKKSASVHENLLRIFLDPSLVEFEGGIDSSLGTDDSVYSVFDLDIDKADTVSEGEHVRQHFLLLKLAVQRLGYWPKDYSEYERLSTELFSMFGNKLKGFDGVEKWNLKAFGLGKASGKEDMLDLEFRSWGLDFGPLGEEVEAEL